MTFLECSAKSCINITNFQSESEMDKMMKPPFLEEKDFIAYKEQRKNILTKINLLKKLCPG